MKRTRPASDPREEAGAAGGGRRADSSYARIYAAVRRIPRGRVATYGLIARLAGLPGHARQVGYALHALRDDGGAATTARPGVPRSRDVPWQRVINARGEISVRSEAGAERLQRALLEREGIAFDVRGRIDLGRFLWRPRGSGR